VHPEELKQNFVLNIPKHCFDDFVNLPQMVKV